MSCRSCRTRRFASLTLMTRLLRAAKLWWKRKIRVSLQNFRAARNCPKSSVSSSLEGGRMLELNDGRRLSAQSLFRLAALQLMCNPRPGPVKDAGSRPLASRQAHSCSSKPATPRHHLRMSFSFFCSENSLAFGPGERDGSRAQVGRLC